MPSVDGEIYRAYISGRIEFIFFKCGRCGKLCCLPEDDFKYFINNGDRHDIKCFNMFVRELYGFREKNRQCT